MNENDKKALVFGARYVTPCERCIISILLLLAFPQSWEP